jgi:hypothetical protein
MNVIVFWIVLCMARLAVGMEVIVVCRKSGRTGIGDYLKQDFYLNLIYK